MERCQRLFRNVRKNVLTVSAGNLVEPHVSQESNAFQLIARIEMNAINGNRNNSICQNPLEMVHEYTIIGNGGVIGPVTPGIALQLLQCSPASLQFLLSHSPVHSKFIEFKLFACCPYLRMPPNTYIGTSINAQIRKKRLARANAMLFGGCRLDGRRFYYLNARHFSWFLFRHRLSSFRFAAPLPEILNIIY